MICGEFSLRQSKIGSAHSCGWQVFGLVRGAKIVFIIALVDNMPATTRITVIGEVAATDGFWLDFTIR